MWIWYVIGGWLAAAGVFIALAGRAPRGNEPYEVERLHRVAEPDRAEVRR